MHRRISTVAAIAACACGALEERATARITTYDAQGTVLLDGRKTFPIGLSQPPGWWMRTPFGGSALAAVTANGVNFLRVSPRHSGWGLRIGSPVKDIQWVHRWNVEAAARGASTWVSLRRLARAEPGSRPERFLRQVVASLSPDAGLAFWKGADEPYLMGWSPALLRNSYVTAREIDPAHPWVIIQAPKGGPAVLRPYSAVTDAHGVDIYPITAGNADPDLHRVGTWTKTIQSVTSNKLVFTTLQVCWSGSMSPSGAVALPTRRQERYMIYDAILNGARGLSFFGSRSPICLGPRDRSLGWNWTYWYSVLRDLIREVGPGSGVYPALLNPGTGLGLHTNDPSTQMTSRQVGPRDIWVIVARHGLGVRNVTVSGLPSSISQGRVYPSGRVITVRAGTITDPLPRWEARVYHFLRPA